MKTDNIIRQYLWLTGTFNFGASLCFATYVAFLISKGLDLFEVNLVNVVFFATMLFWEIPTGAFADTFGRKRSYVIACFVFSMGEIVYSQSNSIIGFMFAEILAGVGRTFANGAYHAWFVDTLKYHGFRGSTKLVFRKEHMTKLFASGLGASAGGYIGSYDLSYPWLLGGIIGIICGILAIFAMKEEYFQSRKGDLRESVKEMASTARRGIAMSLGHPTLRFIIITAVALSFSAQALNMQWQPLYGSRIDPAYIGILGTAILTMLGLGMYCSKAVARGFQDDRAVLVTCCVVSGAGMIAAALTEKFLWLSLTIFLLHEIPRGMYAPLKEAYLNDVISERERATVISCQSAFTHLACLSGLFISGIVANESSISVAWIMSGCVIVIVPLLALRLRPAKAALSAA